MDIILLESIEFYLKILVFIALFDFILDKSSWLFKGVK